VTPATATAVPPTEPTYRCPRCGATWTYRAVRNLARCRDCGSGLVRAG
jgi:DNA-directed RNA polymerase subunit RPC12/RpoP